MAGNARANLVRDLLRACQIGRYGGDPNFEPYLHDPLAVAIALDSTFVTKAQPMRLRLDYRQGPSGAPHTVPVDPAGPNVNLVMQVDRGRFEKVFAKRIVR